jgi:transcriptional regulator NrdR family protein
VGRAAASGREKRNWPARSKSLLALPAAAIGSTHSKRPVEGEAKRIYRMVQKIICVLLSRVKGKTLCVKISFVCYIYILLLRGAGHSIMPKSIIKRNGKRVKFDPLKIRNAILKANVRIATERFSEDDLDRLTQQVVEELEGMKSTPTVEQTQDVVEEKLIAADYAKTAKAYILYRAQHQRLREMDDELVKIYSALTFVPAEDVDLKRENANINADTAMGTMLKYGSEGAKSFYDKYVIPPHLAKADAEGDIHIHDKDFYTLTETCCQIDLIRLFRNGFSTGHGYLREPQDIRSYAALACIAIQANQNEMHGGQSVPIFDYAMADLPEGILQGPHPVLPADEADAPRPGRGHGPGGEGGPAQQGDHEECGRL